MSLRSAAAVKMRKRPPRPRHTSSAPPRTMLGSARPLPKTIAHPAVRIVNGPRFEPTPSFARRRSALCGSRGPEGRERESKTERLHRPRSRRGPAARALEPASSTGCTRSSGGRGHRPGQRRGPSVRGPAPSHLAAALGVWSPASRVGCNMHKRPSRQDGYGALGRTKRLHRLPSYDQDTEIGMTKHRATRTAADHARGATTTPAHHGAAFPDSTAPNKSKTASRRCRRGPAAG